MDNRQSKVTLDTSDLTISSKKIANAALGSPKNVESPRVYIAPRVALDRDESNYTSRINKPFSPIPNEYNPAASIPRVKVSHASIGQPGSPRAFAVPTYIKSPTTVGSPRSTIASPTTIKSPGPAVSPNTAESSSAVGESASSVLSPGSSDINKVFHIDTAAPFESVKEAVSMFGGITDWKAHKVHKIERCKHMDIELGRTQEKIPEYRKQAQAAEEAKVQVLKELESTKRLVEELKLNLEKAQTEEQQAKQDSELAQLRVEEMEQGIGDEVSVAAKAQLEVAKARHVAAVSELKSIKEELKMLHKEYITLLKEKDMAVKKAEDAVSESKEVEKIVDELTIELIGAKEALESAHAAHLESDEQRNVAAMARDQHIHRWERELKHVEEEQQRLGHQICSAKDIKLKLDTASELLFDLKAELTAYMESMLKDESSETYSDNELESEKRTHNSIRAAVTSAKKELNEVKLNIEKATAEVNCLKMAAASMQSELQQEKLVRAAVKQREGMASVAVSSLEAEVDRTRSEIVSVQMKEKEAGEKTVELPKQLQQAAEEVDEAKKRAQLAREELRKAKEEADQAKAGASAMESKLLAARKEIEAAKVSEKLAFEAIKALQESERVQDNDSNVNVTLSVDEYYKLSKRAYDADEQVNTRVAAATSQIEVAKASELKCLETLAEVKKEMAERKEALKIAMAKAEKAREGKLTVEQDLRDWRSENKQLRKAAGDFGQGDNSFGSPRKSFGLRRSHDGQEYFTPPEASLQTSPYPSLQTSPSPSIQTSPTYAHETKVAKKKKRPIFPRIFMFLSKKKSQK